MASYVGNYGDKCDIFIRLAADFHFPVDARSLLFWRTLYAVLTPALYDVLTRALTHVAIVWRSNNCETLPWTSGLKKRAQQT